MSVLDRSAPASGEDRDGGTRVHRLLADAFVAEGVSVVFALMGDGNKLWLSDLHDGGAVRLVHARHEGAALAMADGYARVSGEVGVCAVTYGPGVSQLSTSALVAGKHGTPLVVFAADVADPHRDSGDHLDVDERRLLEAAGLAVVEIRRPERAEAAVHRAFHLARTARRPVALLVGVDVQDRLAPASVPPPAPVAVSPTRPGRGPLREAADLLRSSARPVLLAGRGVALSGAAGELSALGRATGAVVATTFGAKGVMDSDPSWIGLAGGFALDPVRSVLERADLVVAVGASLNDHTTDHGRLFARARVLRIDESQPGPSDRTLHLRGDAASTLRALLETLGDQVVRPAWHRPETDPRLAHLVSHGVAIGDGRLDPRELMLTLDRSLPADAVVVVGGGHFMGFAAQYLGNPTGRRRFELAFDFMTTGQAVPTAIGAATTSGGRMVVAVEGDASFLMHIQELETAARSGIPLLVVVVDDGALGAEYHQLALAGRDPAPSVAEGPDLAAVAAALGGAGRRVTALSELDDLLTWYDAARGPHVLDCLVSRDVRGPL